MKNTRTAVYATGLKLLSQSFGMSIIYGHCSDSYSGTIIARYHGTVVVLRI